MDRPGPMDTDRHGSLSLRRGGDVSRLLLFLEPLFRISEVDRWGPCAHLGKATTLSGQIRFMHRSEGDTGTRTGPALQYSCFQEPNRSPRHLCYYTIIFLMYDSTRWAASGTNWLCTLLQLFKMLDTLMDINNKYRFKQKKTTRLSLRQCRSWMDWFTAAFEHIIEARRLSHTSHATVFNIKIRNQAPLNFPSYLLGRFNFAGW